MKSLAIIGGLSCHFLHGICRHVHRKAPPTNLAPPSSLARQLLISATVLSSVDIRQSFRFVLCETSVERRRDALDIQVSTEHGRLYIAHLGYGSIGI